MARNVCVYTSTYPMEVITCRFGDGTMRHLLCKYSAGAGCNSYGHRGGLSYEAEVYRTVLEPFGGSTPIFHGLYEEPNDGATWLIIEYMENCRRLSKGPLPRVLVDAAGWLGKFHAVFEKRLSEMPLPGLNRYDEEYYTGWARRALQFADRSLHERFPWFRTFCDRAEKFASALVDAPQTVNHGEFYPHNVLVRDGIISPVDWESTAVTVGEIDLAALVEGWPPDTASKCELAYQQARWPEGAPAGFDQTLDAARVYWHLRWLGDKPSWTRRKSSQWRFDALRSPAERWA